MHQRDLAGEPPEGRPRLSLGVRTMSAQLNAEFSQLMELAGQALYAAKGDGRDRVCPTREYPPVLDCHRWRPGIPALQAPVIDTTVFSGSWRLAP